MNLHSFPDYVRIAVAAAQEKQAESIVVLDLSKVGAFTSYFVVCSAFSPPQMQAVCQEIEAQMEKQLGRSPLHREGRGSPDWALLDFGGLVIHVFSERARRFYDLERLWRNAERLEIPSEPDQWAAKKNLPGAEGNDWSASSETVSK